LIARADLDQDGLISEEEFYALMTKKIWKHDWCLSLKYTIFVLKKIIFLERLGLIKIQRLGSFKKDTINKIKR
jgi:hypothetical protein